MRTTLAAALSCVETTRMASPDNLANEAVVHIAAVRRALGESVLECKQRQFEATRRTRLVEAAREMVFDGVFRD